MSIDGGAEAVESPCILALKVQADRLDAFVGRHFERDGLTMDSRQDRCTSARGPG